MPKIHTRKKRLMGLKGSKKHRFYFQKVQKKAGPRTFRTKEQAESYAKGKGMNDFSISLAKKDKRFKIELRK